ncbi:MAG: peptide chain release factor family protein [Deltaproteobacteria bacterium]
MPNQLYIFVNGRAFHVEDGVSGSMSGSEIAALAGISADMAFVLHDIKINPRDLRVDTFRPSISVQQISNVSHGGVRITHLPTGIVVSSHGERSQVRNRVEATRLLRERLSELGHAKPRPIDMREQVQIESGDSFLVTPL